MFASSSGICLRAKSSRSDLTVSLIHDSRNFDSRKSLLIADLAFAERLETMSSFSLSVRYGEWSESSSTMGKLSVRSDDARKKLGIPEQGRPVIPA